MVATDINSTFASRMKNCAIRRSTAAHPLLRYIVFNAMARAQLAFPGYPNLNDDEWLWGGDLEAIEYTLQHGIRQPDHADTRFSQMPAFGRDGISCNPMKSRMSFHTFVCLQGDEKTKRSVTARCRDFMRPTA